MKSIGTDAVTPRHLPYIVPNKAPSDEGGAEIIQFPCPPRINGVGHQPVGMPAPYLYWVAVDSWLVAMVLGPIEATWEELAPLYEACVPVARAAARVLAGRQVTT